jgi:hypothetical protein
MAKNRRMKLPHRTLKTKSTFPFLGLPREIRDLIYERLLTTPYTFTYIAGPITDCRSRPFFDQSCAILLANKQISAEALEIFYTKNEFISLRFIGSIPHFLAKYFDFYDLPTFGRYQKEDMFDPVLTVTIHTPAVGQLGVDNVQNYTLITTIEAIDNILGQLWNFIRRKLPDLNKYWNLTLKFQNRNPLRRKFLLEHILKPWDQVWGFGKITLEGDIDNDLQEHLIARMELGPHPSDVIRYLQLYKRKAENYQKRKLYRHAAWYWNHLHRYWFYNYHGATLVKARTYEPLNIFKHVLKDALKTTQPMLLRMMLERVQISLHLRDYRGAEAYIDRGLDQMMFPRFTLSTTDERELWLVKAGLFLCRAVVNVERGDHSDASRDLNSVARDFINSNTLYHMDLSNIKEKLYWAIDKYFMDMGLPERGCERMEWLVSKNHTDRKVSREGWPTLWEWLDLTEAPRTEDEWETEEEWEDIP